MVEQQENDAEEESHDLPDQVAFLLKLRTLEVRRYVMAGMITKGVAGMLSAIKTCTLLNLRPSFVLNRGSMERSEDFYSLNE